MMKLVDEWRSLSFERKTMLMTFISIFINALLAIGKFVLAFFASPFLVAAAIVNIFVMLSKRECYLGEKYPEKKSFEHRNKYIGFFLLCAGLEYAIYMGRMIFTDTELMKYDMVLGIAIACVSFVEMGFAIAGLFRVYGKGHYYRNAKLINMCSALTAIALTEVAIMSFASETDSRILDGVMGMCVGIIIVLIAVYIYIAPSISIVDRIFTRIGASDDLNSGQSTFMVEMVEVANILNNATSKSLVLLDEVGRGTATYDGMSIAWAVLEYVSQQIRCKTLFSTHFRSTVSTVLGVT